MSSGPTRLSRFADRRTAPILFTTLRNMEPEQLLGIADRTLRHAIVPSLPVDVDDWYDRKVPDTLTLSTAPLRANATTLRRCLSDDRRRTLREWATEAEAGVLTFMNQAVEVDDGDGPEWFSAAVMDLPSLWSIQYHGFEFLRWAYCGYDDPTDCEGVVEVFDGWLADWDDADDTRIGTESYLRRAWTPHAVSFRIMNLARYCVWHEADDAFERLAARVLYRNAAFLSNHVEYDVGGNHLVENGVALVIAGTLFGDDGEQWVEQGVSVLSDAADQFLDDGGHFELSPMYHTIVLTRYLTAIDLLQRRGRPVPTDVLSVAESGTRFLRDICPPDRQIPLLNDSVFGQALDVDACLRYAEAVGVDPCDAPREMLTASGYYWLGQGDDRLLVDGAGIGPDHLPGHTHNDQFAVCLWVDGARVLTDTGTYEYAPTQKRQYARSVAAHNTVQYSDVEPIPISGSYLLGHRFDPTVLAGVRDGVQFFDGAYTRMRNRRPLYTHRRRIYAADDWWLVWDTVDATGSGPVVSRFHVAPEFTVEEATGQALSRFDIRPVDEGTAQVIAAISPLNVDSASVETSQYFPEFGRAITRPMVSLRSTGRTVDCGALLSRRPYRSVAVELDGQTPTGISLDGQSRALPPTSE